MRREYRSRLTKKQKEKKLLKKQEREMSQILEKDARLRMFEEKFRLKHKLKEERALKRRKKYEYEMDDFGYESKETASTEEKQIKTLEFTEKQQEIISLGLNSDILVISAPAGTGKTRIAQEIAVRRLMESDKKIYIIRSAVEASSPLGFMPGKMESKMSHYVDFMYEMMEETLGKQKVNSYKSGKKIEVSPLGFLRGKTFKDCTVIVTESQNMTEREMYLILTRIGSGTTIIVEGDDDQCDITVPFGQKTGLKKVYDIFKEHDVERCHSTGEELDKVLRHPVIESLMKVW